MRYINSMILAAAVLLTANGAMAAIFGTGDNQFTIDFVPISGATNPTSGYGIVDNDYRMGTFEVSNDQWNKFKNNLNKPVTGNPSSAYNQSAAFAGANVPTDSVSWYEAAQFVNWLNTSTNHQAAYKFTGTQGTGDYALATWSPAEAAGGTNLYRNADAFYYLPTEDEWVKAAYWNGTKLQTYATKAGESLTQGDGMSGTGWNYYYYGNYVTDPYGPWNVGSGSEELNGTYDMMGNVMEWMESPASSGDYDTDSTRGFRGGSWDDYSFGLAASYRLYTGPTSEDLHLGFRVASTYEPSVVPEPTTLIVWSLLGGLAITVGWWRRRK